MTELTWQELNRREAEQQAKRQAKRQATIRDPTDRLARILAKEFSLPELQLIKATALGLNALLIESFEIARQKARR